MTWPPNNDIACVADRKEEEELPGADLFWLSYQDDAEICQGYVLGTASNMPRIDVCEINAKEPLSIHRAAEESQSSVERVWKVMDGLLGVKTNIHWRRCSKPHILLHHRYPLFNIFDKPATTIMQLLTSPRTTSCTRRIPIPASRSRSHFTLAIRKGQAPVRCRKASCSFAKDHPTASTRATCVAIGNTTTKTNMEIVMRIPALTQSRVLDQARSRRGHSPSASQSLFRSREDQDGYRLAPVTSIYSPSINGCGRRTGLFDGETISPTRDGDELLKETSCRTEVVWDALKEMVADFAEMLVTDPSVPFLSTVLHAAAEVAKPAIARFISHVLSLKFLQQLFPT
ncbi:hypothetical protein BU17DRAFT_61166 [Hysterangium stoloniferum]|nr:hypothetical protein BU17DRAFT_61166 [Hysterangium stoloniferum]